MTAPKQETWTHANRNNLNAAVIGSIGAVFDFYAETHPRAPKWMHENGLEWLYRMVKEPRRMCRRNFISSLHFLALALRERYRKRFSPSSGY
jgi:N-acetylglucosaminyldiphosphoundecaprenol N-acetyl-beta-D-mannosaminyltransferase